MQLSLWEEPQVKQELVHHYIELHYYGGRHRIIDTANPEDREALYDMSVFSAGFVENTITPRCAKRNGGEAR